MEETQAGGIEFGGTYPVALNYAPFRQKSLGDCTRPLLWRPMMAPRGDQCPLFFFLLESDVRRVTCKERPFRCRCISWGMFVCVFVCVCVCVGIFARVCARKPPRDLCDVGSRV